MSQSDKAKVETYSGLEFAASLIERVNPISSCFIIASIFIAPVAAIVDMMISIPIGIKLASAGLERLVLKDAERETHSDG